MAVPKTTRTRMAVRQILVAKAMPTPRCGRLTPARQRAGDKENAFRGVELLGDPDFSLWNQLLELVLRCKVAELLIGPGKVSYRQTVHRMKGVVGVTEDFLFVQFRMVAVGPHAAF